jgi:hypothetical protein
MLSRETTLMYQNKALEKLVELKKQSIQEVEKPTPNALYSKYIFEQYSDGGMEYKLKHDATYFNVLFENIEQKDEKLANDLLTELSKTVKSIYEHINIQPRSIGAQAIALSESDDIIEKNAARVINEYVTRNYYKLSQEERDAKYKDSVIAESEALVLEHSVDAEEAIEFCYKSVVMEGLIERISFPDAIKFRIDDIMTSDIDKQVFEQTELLDLWSDFKSKAKEISKLIAIAV